MDVMKTPVSSTSGRLVEPGSSGASRNSVAAFLSADVDVDWSDPELPVCPLARHSPALEANRAFFGHPAWAENYLRSCHRNEQFRARWQAATGSWDGKIVVDIGCGPGNLFAVVGGSPRLLIGVDVARGGLAIARTWGYAPVLADAHALPFISDFADLVVLNATLHHCEDMPRALAEAARLVAPGGRLVTDHDPQLSAWEFRGLARWGWENRAAPYRRIKDGYHRSWEAQSLMLSAAIHHEPGEGLSPAMYHDILAPLGFSVEVYPHNHDVGAEVFQGKIGRAAGKYRLAQRLSGLNPDSPDSALSLLCRAIRRNHVIRAAARQSPNFMAGQN